MPTDNELSKLYNDKSGVINNPAHLKALQAVYDAGYSQGYDEGYVNGFENGIT